MNWWTAFIVTSSLLITKRRAGGSPEKHMFKPQFLHVCLKLEISPKYLSFNKFVNYTQMTNALLYDAFIQRLCLPLEVFKKICKCLWGDLFLNNPWYGTVLYRSVLCSFCWILFWMCNLFNLYLLVLFHSLKVFVSDALVSNCYPFMFFHLHLLYTDAQSTLNLSMGFTGIQAVDVALKQISVKLIQQRGRGVHKEMRRQE